MTGPFKLLSRTAGEEGPSAQRLVGEGGGALQQVAIIFLGGGSISARPGFPGSPLM
jgi:hypothetical protein